MSRGGIIFKCFVFGVTIAALIGLVVMLLWNWLVPELFKGPVISYWQALGLLVLSKIIFGGWGGKGGCQHQGPGSQWRDKMYNKFSTLTPEERETFKSKLKEKWCRWEGNSDVDMAETKKE